MRYTIRDTIKFGKNEETETTEATRQLIEKITEGWESDVADVGVKGSDA
jgi:hypothetical protein